MSAPPPPPPQEQQQQKKQKEKVYRRRSQVYRDENGYIRNWWTTGSLNSHRRELMISGQEDHPPLVLDSDVVIVIPPHGEYYPSILAVPDHVYERACRDGLVRNERELKRSCLYTWQQMFDTDSSTMHILPVNEHGYRVVRILVLIEEDVIDDTHQVPLPRSGKLHFLDSN